MNRKKLLRDTHALRQIAVEAVVDDRTVARHLRGERVLNSSRVRIDEALRRLGIADKPAHEGRGAVDDAR